MESKSDSDSDWGDEEVLKKDDARGVLGETATGDENGNGTGGSALVKGNVPGGLGDAGVVLGNESKSELGKRPRTVDADVFGSDDSGVEEDDDDEFGQRGPDDEEDDDDDDLDDDEDIDDDDDDDMDDDDNDIDDDNDDADDDDDGEEDKRSQKQATQKDDLDIEQLGRSSDGTPTENVALEKGDSLNSNLNPLLMIDAQPGQHRQRHAVFGTRAEDIFRPKKRLRGDSGKRISKRRQPGGASGKRRISKETMNLIGRANQLYVDQRYDEAIAMCNEIVRQNPRISDPYHLLTSIWYEKGDKEKEFNALEWAVDLDQGVNKDNLARLVELGLALGRDSKLGLYSAEMVSDSEDSNSDVDQPAASAKGRENGAFLHDDDDDDDNNKSQPGVGKVETLGQPKSPEKQKSAPTGIAEEANTESTKIENQAKPKSKEERRLYFLRVAERMSVRILRRKFSLEMSVLRGEILEHQGYYKRAADAFKRLVKRCIDERKLNLVVVHRLARAYRLRNELKKTENILEKHVASVLAPTVDELPHIRAAALKSESERKTRERERSRRREALKKRRELVRHSNSLQPEVAMAVETKLHEQDVLEKKVRIQQKRARRKALRQGKDIRTGSQVLLPKLGTGLEDLLNEEEPDPDADTNANEDDELLDMDEVRGKEIEAERVQLEAGINILSMLVEVLIDRNDYSRALEYLERYAEFTQNGLCAFALKNQWQYWGEIKPNGINLDLMQMLVVCHVNLENYRRAREYMKMVEAIPLEGADFRTLLFFQKIAEAWMKRGKHVMALEQFERIIDVPNLKSFLRVEALSKASYCCEYIDHHNQPERAAETAYLKAIALLEKLVDLVGKKVETGKFDNLEEFKDAAVYRLERILRKYKFNDKADDLIVKHGQSANYKENYASRSSALSLTSTLGEISEIYSPTLTKQTTASPSGQQVTELKGNGDVAAIKATGGAKAPLPPPPPMVRFELKTSDSALTADVKRIRARVPRFNYGPAKNPFVMEEVRPCSFLSNAMVQTFEALHSLFKLGEFQACLRGSVPLLAGFFQNDPELYQSFKAQVFSLLDPAMPQDSRLTAIWNASPSEELVVKIIDNDVTMRFVQEFCVCLMNYQKSDLASQFLGKIIPRRAKGIKSEPHKSHALVLFAALAADAQDYDILSKELMNIARKSRDVLASENAEAWGDNISFLWETLNAALACMRWGDYLYANRVVYRRLDRLAYHALEQGRSEKMDSFALTMLLAHNQTMSQNPVKALSTYNLARDQCPSSPLVGLCLATTYLRLYLFSSLSSEARNTNIVKAFAHLEDYKSNRLAYASDSQRASLQCETFYNLGRAAHAVGLPLLMEHFYRQALAVPQASVMDKREAAYNLALFYRKSGSLDAAKALHRRYLVL